MFNTLVKQVAEWATDRGIRAHATVGAQLLKMFSEIGELSDNVIKHRGTLDDIGDITVCLINAVEMSGGEVRYPDNQTPAPLQIPEQHMAMQVIFVATSLLDDWITKKAPLDGSDLLFVLNRMAIEQGSTLTDCLQLAYDEIKERTGSMTAGGAFVKDD